MEPSMWNIDMVNYHINTDWKSDIILYFVNKIQYKILKFETDIRYCSVHHSRSLCKENLTKLAIHTTQYSCLHEFTKVTSIIFCQTSRKLQGWSVFNLSLKYSWSYFLFCIDNSWLRLFERFILTCGFKVNTNSPQWKAWRSQENQRFDLWHKHKIIYRVHR